MFRLESYLTPWLLGYLDKYVKLKPEDFQLSLWGGDAVFNKLDLRLNVIESLTNIPITFKSGVIHELRIHIPWTRITSEPVVVTINTLEFVAKLKDVDSSSVNTTSTSLNKTPQPVPSEAENLQQSQDTQVQPIPTGYIQNIISKILFNICIIVNNVIVKFVEDDMVLSFNMKSAEFYSVNELWEKTFVDINTSNINLKKILQLNDVTICLDKLDSKKNSKISFYQDPLIYRCSIESRLDFKYSLGQSSNNFDQQLKLIKLNFYCRKFDVSVTDQQLPMVIRLIELILAIVDGNLNLPEGGDSENYGLEVTENITSGLKIVEEIKQNIPIEEVSQEQQGWMSWAWSYVPSVTSLISEPGQNDQDLSGQLDSKDIHMIIGCYFDQFNLTFKLIQNASQMTANNSGKNQSNFVNFISCNLKGIGVEVNKKRNYSHILFGISHIILQSNGECCCKLCSKPSENEIVFLRAGNDYLEDKTFHYLSNSLFDISIVEPISDTKNQNDSKTNLSESSDSNKIEKSRDKLGNIDENYGLKRFGAIFMDYLSSENNENDESQDLSDIDIQLEFNPNQPDIFSLYFLFYSIEINASANLIHRLCKLYDCSLNHNYTEPYARNDKLRSESATSLTEASESNDTSSPLTQSPVKMARKFEKYIPMINQNFIFKDPVIRFHPYNHFLIAPIASQQLNFECHFNLNINYLFFNITRPFDEKSLFDVVSKLPNPSKKLIYDSYVHNQLTADGLKLTMIINNTNFKYESTIIEPCYLELNFSDVIMSPEMWNKQYFPLNEFFLELPVLNLNLSKEIVFIIYDYLDSYLFSLLDNSMMEKIKRPFMNKTQMKKSKYRQIIYKRLLQDYIRSTKYNKSEIIRISINDLKIKYSLTKIMQIIQFNCNMCNLYLFKNDHSDLIPLVETSNRAKNSHINDFITLKAQLPLKIDSENSYIPDPLFIYLNINESNIQIRDDFIKWLSYKPSTKGDNELLNLLVLDLFEDVPNLDKTEDNYNLLNRMSKPPSEPFDTSSSKKSLIYHTPRQIHHDDSLSMISNKPTLIDTFYDLIKALHVQVSIKPVRVDFTHLESTLSLTLPQLDAKSSGTKCDLEEELITKLAELPCTYLRACEKTSNKLPWVIELKSLGLTLKNESNIKILMDKIDLNSVFTVKPKYHQYDNLLSSMSIVCDIEISKKIDLKLDLTVVEFFLNIFKLISDTIENFDYKINYNEIEGLNTSRTRQASDDDTKSYSSISILKEYDWIDTDETKSEFDDEHFSPGDLSSSSESMISSNSKRRSKNLNPIKNLSLQTQKNDEQAKINFSLNFLVTNLNLELVENDQKYVNLALNRLIFESDMNQIYQKYEIKLKKMNINSSHGQILSCNVTDNFVTMTFTNALVKNLTKRIGIKLTRGLKKNFEKHHKWIGEVNLTLGEFEFRYNSKLFETLFRFVKLLETQSQSEPKNESNLIPVVKSIDIPLINLELKKVRLVIPDEKDLVLQFSSMILTSQFENPLIRNFVQNSSSQQIYLKAKSRGLIYRPGFLFEDRQYLMNIKNLGFLINNDHVVQDFDLRLIVALPIIYGPRLINGYVLELNVHEIGLELDPEKLNLVTRVFNENFSSESSQTAESCYQNLSLVPCDLLVTFEKINIDLKQKNESILNASLIQPHVCFFMHENLQKFEISIYDMCIKHGVLETKPGEPDAKTGILSGLFMFRIKNFAKLFQPNRIEIWENVPRKSIVCNTCFKLNELDRVQANDKLKTEIFIERPMRLKVNFNLVDSLIKFVNDLNFIDEKRNNPEVDEPGSDLIKFMNLHALCSQIVLMLDLNEKFSLVSSFNGMNIKADNQAKSCSGSFKLNDLNVSLSLVENDWNAKMHVFGPMSVSGLFGIDSNENEVNLYSDFGSFSFTFNRYIFECINELHTSIQKYTIQDESHKNNVRTEKLEISKIKDEQIQNLYTKYNDDLRNGSFSYKIIDDNYIKKNSSTTQIDDSYVHILAPSENEIICVDDLTNQTSNLISSVCWKYSKKRAITSLKILPLPFIGSQEIKSNVKFKFYLEFLNEASKRFELITEFEIQEGMLTNVLDLDITQYLLTDLTWSKTWRIRLSNESKKFIFASSLLASTRVDSIELEHGFYKLNLDLKISNLECRLNSVKKMYSQADLVVLNISDLMTRFSSFQVKDQKIMSCNLIGQLGVDYAEYQFGTFRPLIDPLRLKLTSRITDRVTVNSYIDTVNLLVSQSGLITFKLIEDEFKQISSYGSHYFLVHNDTNLDLSIKQFDTEETCLIPKGANLPYIWRTHKKLPLMQIYVPKYKKYSQKFTLNNYDDKSVIQEVKIDLGHGEFMSLLINLDNDMCRKENKKVVLIQTKFFLCNYLNTRIDWILFKYNGKSLDVESVDKFSRSTTSLELIESVSNQYLPIENLKIGIKDLKVSFKDLIDGVLWESEESKFWVNLHYNEQLSQYSLIFSPQFVLCSYLPYELTLDLNENIKVLGPNSCFFCSDSNDKLKIEIVESTHSNKATILHAVIKNSEWYEQKVQVICQKNLNPNLCNFENGKRLLIHNPFEYNFVNLKSDSSDKIDVRMKKSLREGSKEASEVETFKKEMTINFLKSKFLITKTSFWPLSPTLRVNFRAECVLLNRTEFNVRITEFETGALYDLDRTNGQLCFGESDGGKKYKFTVLLDEYALKNIEKVDLEKQTVEYESEWVEIKDEPVSPFYRERPTNHILYMNKCWIDLKLYPKNNSNSRYECIYFVLNTEDRNYLNKNLNEFNNENLSSANDLLTESTYRLLKLEPKFVVKNKLDQDLDLFISNSYKLLNHSLIRTHVTTEKNHVPSKHSLEISYVLNRKNMFISDPDVDHGVLDGLNFLAFENFDQSKSIILTCKEKPLKQLNSQNENLLISRQCVNLSKGNVYSGVIVTQKLLVNQNGQLIVIIKQDPDPLVTIKNSLKQDIYVWPRLSTNFIFENYVKNSSQSSMFRNSVMYMHRIPVGGVLKYNYDFLGTNYFPIENINEQIMFMFANDKYELSQNLCKIYSDQVKVDLNDTWFYYSKRNSNTRVLTQDSDYEEDAPIDPGFRVGLNLNIERLTLALNNDFLSNLNQVEILRLTVDDLSLSLNELKDFKISLKHIQLDNQMYDNEKYDFPVVFIPREINGLKNKYLNYSSIYPESMNPTEISDEFLTLKFKLKSSNSSIEMFEIDMKPFDLYLEDCLVTDLIKLSFEYIQLVADPKKIDDLIELDLDLITNSLVRIKNLKISKIDSLITLQTSAKLYLATHKTPVVFDEFIIKGLPESIQSLPQLVNKLTSHYLTSLIFRAGWVIGSLDLIGSPTAFVQQVSNGIFDFLLLPYRGVRRDGPTGLFQGFTQGSMSLIRNLSSGTITSMTSFASFISRNMDILSFDPHHLARQESFRHQTSDSLSSGLLQVSSSFLISIMGAIGGLAEQPIQSVQNSDSILKGVSKGLIGLVTKPVGAVAELVNQTGQGLLKITGANRIPLGELRLHKRPLNKEFSKFSISTTKFVWKLLNESKHAMKVNSIVECVYTSRTQSNLSACYLVLSEEILYMMDKHEDMLLRAFYISEIDVKLTRNGGDGEVGLCVILNSQQVEGFVNEYDKLYENNLSRLVEYVMNNENKKNEFLVTCSCGVNLKPIKKDTENVVGRHLRQESATLPKIHRLHSNTSQTSTRTNGEGDGDNQQKRFYFYIDPRVSDNFINIFNSLKRKASNKGFQY